MGNYVLDFYCPAEKLAVELDGEVHYNDHAREADNIRNRYLKQSGIMVLRFENRMVFEEMETVIGRIKYNFGWNKK